MGEDEDGNIHYTRRGSMATLMWLMCWWMQTLKWRQGVYACVCVGGCGHWWLSGLYSGLLIKRLGVLAPVLA